MPWYGFFEEKHIFLGRPSESESESKRDKYVHCLPIVLYLQTSEEETQKI